MRDAKVLLKDLPFGGLSNGVVVTKLNNRFIIERGHAWLDGKMKGAHNGHTIFTDVEEDVLATIFEDAEWFASVRISPVKYSRESNRIVLDFGRGMDLSDIERIAKGIQKTLVEYYSNTVKEMGWSGEESEIIFDS